MHTKPNEPQTYRGWSIHYARTTPAVNHTGRWIATRNGQALDAICKTALYRMIDRRTVN